MKNRIATLVAIALPLCVGACKKETTPTGSANTSAQLSAGKPATPKKATKPGNAASKPTMAAPAKPSGPRSAGLMDPSKAAEKAPEKFTVKFETTKGEITIDVTRAWAPNGADRFYNLVKAGFYNEGVAMFRVIGGFMAQFGIHGDPKVAGVWRNARIKDDPVKGTNAPGMVTFAMAGPNTRTSQIFINFGNNTRLDSMGFAPFGKVRDMTVMKSIYSGYGEGAPRGRGPDQGMLQSRGNEYLKERFPKMDYINRATIVQ